jgi:hypothetical protein
MVRAPGIRGRSARPGEPEHDLVVAVVVEPFNKAVAVSGPGPMSRHRDKAKTQPGHPYLEACLLEDAGDLVEVV